MKRFFVNGYDTIRIRRNIIWSINDTEMMLQIDIYQRKFDITNYLCIHNRTIDSDNATIAIEIATTKTFQKLSLF